MADRHSPRPPSGNVSTAASGWLKVECVSGKTRASLPLDAIRRPRDTALWKLEASLKCQSCRKGRYAPPVPPEYLNRALAAGNESWRVRIVYGDEYEFYIPGH